MAKAYRRSIRVGGKTINSPRFHGPNAKAEAARWYSEKLKEKEFVEKGLISGSAPTFMTYASMWIQRRMQSNPKSTWAADEQRLRTYLLPNLSEFPLDRITRQQMRAVLERVQREHKLAIATRTRILALASKIFNDALNENPPMISANPCVKLSFNDPRKGKKPIATLEDWDEVREFLKLALEFGDLEFVACTLALGAGLRKSEASALKWRNVRWKQGMIIVDSHVEQASNTIMPGTKAGQDELREVPMAGILRDALEAFRSRAQYIGADDFILADANGEWIRPRDFHRLIEKVTEKFGRPITYHKLRHSYGRLWAMENGNIRALQQILGHKSASTTQIYSEMTPKQLQEIGKSYAKGISIETDIVRDDPPRLTPKRHHDT